MFASSLPFPTHRHQPLLAGAAAVLCLLFAGTAAAERQLNDANIAQAVQRELQTDPRLDAADIDLTVSDGAVTLTGSAPHLPARRRAADLAGSVRGVTQVNNELRVDAPDRSDEQIAKDVRAAIEEESALNAEQIQVSVQAGVVTLAGRVNQGRIKQLAGQTAGSIIGVRNVENMIHVATDQRVDDIAIARNITRQLMINTAIDAAGIDVAVDDGVVTLAGVVASESERRAAEELAWVDGVRQVNANLVKVEGWDRQQRFRGDKYAPKSDQQIVQDVISVLALDPRLRNFDITVHADDGVVTLSGAVPSSRAQLAAFTDARNVVGVKKVNLELDVMPGDQDQPALADRVQRALQRHAELDGQDISVSVDDRAVRLAGQVQEHYHKALAQEVAAGIRGVTAIENNIVVRSDASPLVYDPRADEWYYYAFSWATESDMTQLPNSDEIAQEIEDELWWSPFVDSDDVTVTVERGVATLEGVVESRSEADAAVENAYEGGAIGVINNLRIQPED